MRRIRVPAPNESGVIPYHADRKIACRTDYFATYYLQAKTPDCWARPLGRTAGSTGYRQIAVTLVLPSNAEFFNARSSAAWIGVVSLLAAFPTLAPFVVAQSVWSGFDYSFTKAEFVDPTLAANQDRITSNVWITRNVNQGIFNIHDEAGYTAPGSPAGTQWATELNNPGETIAATNWDNLTFTDWVTAYGGQGTMGLPNRLLTYNAVVHLLDDNTFLDLQFTGWSTGGGGGFSYDRAAAPPPPTPTGDYNHNGVVDAADYVAWRDTLTQTVSPAGSGADGDGSGTIDAGDYSFWRARFGDVVAGAGAGQLAVPEPSSVGLLASGLIAVALWALSGSMGRLRTAPGRRHFAKQMPIAAGLAASALLFMVITPAHASFHLWRIAEVFSSTDGSVQFIEMVDNFAGENLVGGHQLQATSDGVTNTFTIPSNLPSSATANHRLLFATPGFGSLAGGVTPDYTLPAGPFIDPAAVNISINFSNVDTLSFTGSTLPLDGAHSLVDSNPYGVANLLSATNTPTNFTGTSGSVNLITPTGDYNGDGVVDAADYVAWRDTLTQTVSPAGSGADGNGSGTIDAGDYSFWRGRFGNSAGAEPGAANVPEPDTMLLFLAFTGLRVLFGATAKSMEKCISMASIPVWSSMLA